MKKHHFSKRDKLLDEKILEEVCNLMNIKPTEEHQEFFMKDTIKDINSLDFEEIFNNEKAPF